MAQYLLLLYDNPANRSAWTKFTPQQIQEAMGKYGAYGQKLRDKKLWIAGHKLADEPGRVLRKEGNQILATDGPHSETKEWLGGFYLIEALNYNAAVEASRDCPHLEHGGTIEVREIDAMVAARANAKAS
jgi:hypothetical protein